MNREKLGMSRLSDDELNSVSGGAKHPVICEVVVKDDQGNELGTFHLGTVFNVTGNTKIINGTLHYEVFLPTGSDPGYVESSAFSL